MTTIANNLQHVLSRIQAACVQANRSPHSVELLAVSKTFGPDAVRQAFAAGQKAFGENYIQEGVDKIHALADLAIVWHCIGPIQSNKTRLVAEHFHWAHSIDRLKTAQRLSAQRPAHLPELQVCIQVNVDAGPSKAGVSPADALTLARAVQELPRLRLRGIMTIPEPSASFEAACTVHRQAGALFADLNARGMALDVLSMGMSSDLEAAVHCGSTLLRVGSAIFGGRSYPAAIAQAA